MTDFSLLCVHPHPDDESIATGGVLARYADEGIGCHVVTCTGGEAGDNLAGIDLQGHDLTTHRRRELTDALAELGPIGHDWLGYRDSGMAGRRDNRHPEAFVQADLDEVAARLAAIIRRVRPDVVISDAEHGTYGHPDHIRSHHATVRACRMAADPTAAVDGAPHAVSRRFVIVLARQRLRRWHRAMLLGGLSSPWADVDDPTLAFGTAEAAVTCRIDVRPWLPRKLAAMRAHRSQLGGDSFFLNLPETLADRLLGIEEFSLAAGDLDGRHHDDLFTGLRRG